MTAIWCGVPAMRLEDDTVEVVVLPGRGAKIASLRHRPTSREWLLQPSQQMLPPVSVGDDFTSAALSGWDEMLPTITACADPNSGGPLPDHGEVWSRPWHVEASSPTRLTTSIEGHALDYRLTRSIAVSGAGRIRLDYELGVVGGLPLALLWAAHPQFVATASTRVRLGDDVGAVTQVHPSLSSSPIGWPGADADRVTALPAGACRKLYLDPSQPSGGAGLIDEDTGAWLRLAWDPRIVPYLGIWLDNRACAHRPVVALEPSTGYYDDLSRAFASGQVMTVTPGAPARWSIDVSVGAA